MRLLFLGIHARERSPCQRFRFEQFEPLLESKGVRIEYANALAGDEASDFYGPSSTWTKGRIAGRGLLRRAFSVRPRLFRPRFDVVFVQREAFFLFGAWSEWLARLQAPIVFDFDDAIWIHAVSPGNRRYAFFKNVSKIPRIARLSHSVIAGNEFLASWARQYNQNVCVIPTCIDTERWRPPLTRRSEGPVTVGWSGSMSTVAHLRLLLPALERVRRAYGDRVRFRVMGDAGFRHTPLGLAGEAWHPDAEIPFLQDLDIGLMPLPDDEWSKGKCGLKGLASMACGAATVMSPVGVNREIVQDGVNGLLAQNDDEWVKALSRLIDDAALRQRLGVAGRSTVETHYSVARWVGPLEQVLRSAVSRRAQSAGAPLDGCSGRAATPPGGAAGQAEHVEARLSRAAPKPSLRREERPGS